MNGTSSPMNPTSSRGGLFPHSVLTQPQPTAQGYLAHKKQSWQVEEKLEQRQPRLGLGAKFIPHSQVSILPFARTVSWMGPPQGNRVPRVDHMCIVLSSRIPGFTLRSDSRGRGPVVLHDLDRRLGVGGRRFEARGSRLNVIPTLRSDSMLMVES